MNRPPLAQCRPNHHLAAVAVALQFVPGCHYSVDRHVKATQQVQVDVTAQMEGVASAPYHEPIKIAVRPIRPRAADAQRMILSGRATSHLDDAPNDSVRDGVIGRSVHLRRLVPYANLREPNSIIPGPRARR